MKLEDDLQLRVEAVREEHLPSLIAFFEQSSCTCFCRYWHFTGTKNEWLDRCANRSEENAAELEAAVRGNDPSGRGLVAIAPSSSGDEKKIVVGWMKLTERKAVPKLRSLPVYRSLDLGDETTTLSIACMLVHPNVRGKGVARALVAAAGGIASGWGARTIEAYPRRSSAPLHPEEAWQGPERIFADLGFEAVHDVSPYPVYRKTI